MLGPQATVFLSEPLAAPLMIAGNPIAYLRLTSDRAGGLVAVHLYDVGPDFIQPRATRKLKKIERRTE